MRKIFFIGSLMLATASPAVEQHIQCPKRFPAHEVKIPEVPRGWNGTGIVHAGMPLESAGAIDGPYTGMRAELHGRVRKIKTGSEQRFDFEQKEKWLYCSYGGGVELLHRVAESATQCVVRYSNEASPEGPDIAILCR